MVSDPTWLASRIEDAVDPDLPIIDPHHHLWGYPRTRYFLDELLADTADHNVRQTVFVECGAMYRADGPESMKPLGETEFVQGIAAQSASGHYGAMRVATGIVGHADLRLGAAVAEVLDAQMRISPQRFRGIRHHASWDPHDDVPNSRIEPGPEVLGDPTFRDGFACLADYDLSFEGWLYHPQIPELTDLARAFPQTTIILNHLGGAWDWALRQQAGGGFRVVARVDRNASDLPQRRGQGGRHPDADQRLRLAPARDGAQLGRAAGNEPALVRAHDRTVRA